MKDYSNLPFNPGMERLVEHLMDKTQNEDPQFFRLMVSYYYCKVASMMRCNVQFAQSQTIPVNMYAINMAPSGAGKGHSIGIIEEDVIGRFRTKFLEETFPQIAERNLNRIGIKRARKNQSDEAEEVTRAQMEFEEQGELLFSFDSGTSAAVKQMRVKLLLASAGSMNFEMDEMGSNLLGNAEILTTFLELYDMGKVKQKLIKNTRESIRSEDLFGTTPTNMMLFGTPTKLLNGSKTEDEFYDFLEVGYGRRCYFAFCRRRHTKVGQTAQDIYDIYNDTASKSFLAGLSDQMAQLADPVQFGQTLKMQKDVSMALFEYKLWCQTNADEMTEFEEIAKAELAHRYFKVAKLAGAYAFIDKATYVGMDHLENAIAMAEMSGVAFSMMMKRDRPHIKLAKYLSGTEREMTHSDLVEDLPFYKGSEQFKREMVNLATAYGYKNNIIIRRDMIDGIELLSGKTLPNTNLKEIVFSASQDITTGYTTYKKPFEKMHNLIIKDNYHWITHGVRDAYRDEAHIIEGFNLVCLDVENSVSIDTAKLLLKDFKYLLHTTKRHTETDQRFRVILPISHTLSLDGDDFKEFMNNIYDWLPFDVDRQTAQRSRKWLTNNGKHWYNDGQLLDALQFIPKTKKADEHQSLLAGQTNLSNLERWFINNTANGNRNHQLLKYAYALIDTGDDLNSINLKIMDLNRKLAKPLDETEVHQTVIASANKQYHLKRKS